MVEAMNRLDAGEVTAVELTAECLRRIHALDDSGPNIGAITWINAEALTEARRLDQEMSRKGRRSPLHGIPFVVKDNVDVAGTPTTAGCLAMRDSRACGDATIVRRLRDAGAVIIGKANMSELALSYGWLGYSSTGGLTRNPYNLRRNASGSSSGPAAAVASGFAFFSIGTDSAGSIRAPAATTSLVGVKPTRGLLSCDGIVPLARSLDVPGPLTHTVADAAIVLSVIAGADERDPMTAELPRPAPSAYLRAVNDQDTISNARIGVLHPVFSGHPEVGDGFREALRVLENEGADNISITLRDQDSLWPQLERVIQAEFKPQLESYLATVDGGPGTLEEILRVTASAAVVNPARIAGYEATLRHPGLADAAYLHTIAQVFPSIRESIIKTLDEHSLDALVFPTMACPASSLKGEDDPEYQCDVDDPYVMSYIASAGGLPEITVPAGYTSSGVPIGISFLGRPFSEPRLLGIAHAFEIATLDRRRAPGSVFAEISSVMGHATTRGTTGLGYSNVARQLTPR